MKSKVILGICLAVVPLTILFSYSENKQHFTRNVSAINKTVFYGIKSANDKDSLLQLMVKDVNTIFDLPDIYASDMENEIRVYYVNAFGSLFFRQQFAADSTKIDLFVCGGKKNNDSLFMKIDYLVSVKGLHRYDGVFDASGIRSRYEWIEDQDSDALDNISQYTVQLKNKKEIKYLLIDDPCGSKNQTSESKFVCKIARQISKDFSFNFNSSIDDIINSAMINPYVRN
jgi:hypothetical protein